MNFYYLFIRCILSLAGFIKPAKLMADSRQASLSNLITAPFRRARLTQALSAVLIFSILTTFVIPVAAAPQTLGAISEKQQDVSSWLSRNNWLGRLYDAVFASSVDDSSYDRNASISRIEIYPGNSLKLATGSKTNFAAIAFDGNDQQLSGVDFKWKITDIGRKQNTRNLPRGAFEAKLPGNYQITVEARGMIAETTVEVTGIPLEILERGLAKGAGKTVSSRSDMGSQPISEQNDAEKSETTTSEISKSPDSQNIMPEGGWNEGNWQSADDPQNQIGDAPGNPLDDGAGNGNFQLSVPILSLSGRSIDLDLSLNYNSRLWNKSGNQLTYDIDKGFPAGGWTFGFGKMSYMGATGGCMLVDGDGTRHGYTGQLWNTPNSTTFTGHTTDGTFIDYGCSVYYGNSSHAWARLANGTIITYATYGPANDQIYPISVQDAQGNYIYLTYRNGYAPYIETITDTMGRVISFQYDSDNRLISVTAPKPGGGTRTVMRINYQQLTLNYSFTGVTPVVRESAPYVIKSIYYPGTQTGYWFGDTNSYSSYGMIAKVIEQRGMNWTSGGVNNQGTISPGTMTRQADYNYPLTPTGGLSDAPTYGQLTETWAAMNDAAAVTNYQFSNNSTPRTVTITQPDGTKSTQYSYNYSSAPANDPNKYKDGLVYQDDTYDANNNLISQSKVTWEPGEYSAPRPTRTETTDERGQTIYTTIDYTGGRFNQITRSCDYGYGNNLLRCTNNEYENRNVYIHNQHIFNLIKSTEVRAADNTRVSRTEYEYDNEELIPVPAEVLNHEDRYDPNTTTTQSVQGRCIRYEQLPYNEGEYCVEWEYYEESVFDPYTNFRGNPTKITSYANAQNLTQSISDIKQYDVTGNMVKSTTADGSQTSFVYTLGTQYAYPSSQTRGASDVNSPARITTSKTFDFNTGLEISSTDANGRVSTMQYNAENLRPTVSTLPTGGYVNYIYDDAAMSATEETRENGGNIASETVKYLNGLGKVRREESRGLNNNWDAVEKTYNKSGREWKQSRPYRVGTGTPQWSENFYDALGRVTKIAEPDGSYSQAFYNEVSRPDSASSLGGQTVRMVDAWGRERWIRRDEQNRVAEVVEPNPNGGGSLSVAGSIATKYKYDTLGRLTETEQGSQHRYFAYDSLGRLMRQKLAEQTATLDANGTYVGAGGAGAQWSEAFWYDNRSNITLRTDARGVKTHFSYTVSGVNDPLNRIQATYYDLSGPRDPNLPIHGTWNVFYEYEPSGDKTRIKRVTAAGMSTEDYLYDSEGRVADYTLTLLSRSDYPMKTTYQYDTLSRITDVQYPAQYGAGNARKTVHQDYAMSSYLTAFKYNGQTQVSDLVYNADGQATSLKIGTGSNQLTEEYNFDAQTGLLTNQKLKRTSNGDRLLDLNYEYRRKVNGAYVAGRTGHLTEIVNNLDRNKDRSYQYDALGRLVKASGGVNQSWTQQYAFDRYGNRTSVTASGNEALRSAANPDQQKKIVPNDAGLSREQPPTAEKLFNDVNSLVDIKPATNTVNQNETNSTTDPNSPKTEINSPPPTVSDEMKTAVEGMKSEASPLTTPTPATAFDFDGDGRADISTWHRTNGTWTVKRSQSGTTTTSQLGGSGNQIVPGDYDGDRKTDEAVWNTTTGSWTIKQSSNGSTYNFAWGMTGDTPVPADYDGDGKTDIAVWRPSTGFWYIVRSSDGSWFGFPFGAQSLGDIPVAGDFDGDGRADVTVWRPETGTWYSYQTTNGNAVYYWGKSGDVPVAADYDGDNKTDLAVYRPSEGGNWYIYQSSNGNIGGGQLGSEATRDVPIPADYDGDRKTDIAVWTPSTGTWSIKQSTTGSLISPAPQLGSNATLAVPSAYVRRSGSPKNQNAEIGRDGHSDLTYNAATNRITTAGFEYDAAGNLTRALTTDGLSWQRFEYDSANRLIYVKNDAGTVLQTSVYGATNSRLITRVGTSGDMTFYSWVGGNVISEYTEYASQPNVAVWSKSYIFMGGRLLSTATNSGGNESIEYHHPDRLGTKLVSNPATGGFFEQATLPFGTPLNSESTGATNQRFTNYDRSAITGLDYAVNRTYDSSLGQFTQVDPLGIRASSLESPQTLNLYSYCANDPVNHTDPDGLFFGALFKAIGKFFKAVGRILLAITQAINQILNNRWVRIGVFIAGFILPGLHGVLAAIVTKAIKIYNLISDITSSLEIVGQVLSGKWKELAITMGFAFVSAIIAPLIDGFITGVQSEIFPKMKSSFSKQMSLGWHQFKNKMSGLKQVFIGLTPFMGPGVPADDELETRYKNYEDSIDGAQMSAKQHDIDLLNAKKNTSLTNSEYLTKRKEAHGKLVRGLFGNGTRLRFTDIAFAGRPSVGSVYRFIGISYFSASWGYLKAKGY